MARSSEPTLQPRAAILLELSCGEAYGVEINERIRSRGGHEISMATLYPTLEKLTQEGLLSVRESEPLPERGGRRRNYYKLTALGARAVEEHRQVLRAAIGDADLVWSGVGVPKQELVS